MEILWTFSIYLESVAILPQLFMVQKTGEAESITSHYLFALGSYRGLYILNWIYRYYFEGNINFHLVFLTALVIMFEISRLLWYHRHCCWMCSNHSVLRLLLSLHHQGLERQKATVACINMVPTWERLIWCHINEESFTISNNKEISGACLSNDTKIKIIVFFSRCKNESKARFFAATK